MHNPVRGGSGALEQWANGSELTELAGADGVRGNDAATLVATAVGA